jgi:hypothetical protein
VAWRGVAWRAVGVGAVGAAPQGVLQPGARGGRAQRRGEARTLLSETCFMAR